MADFSKQWCYLNDPEMPHDFDIETIADSLQPDYYKSFICEGFGFTAIGKDSEGKTILYFPSKDLETGEWKDYEEFINEEKRREW
jgi:hypothetical protein